LKYVRCSCGIWKVLETPSTSIATATQTLSAK
jgi:hypothetical protein